MARSSYFDDFGFDNTRMEYAQVLEEARRHSRAVPASESKGCHDNYRHHSRSYPDLVNAEISFPPANCKADDLKKSLGDLKKRRSWKNTLFFWRKPSKKNKEVQATPQYPGYRSKSLPLSGPIYANDLYAMTGPTFAPTRPKSGPISSTATLNQNVEAEMPYIPLGYHNHLRVSATTPIYTVS